MPGTRSETQWAEDFINQANFDAAIIRENELWVCYKYDVSGVTEAYLLVSSGEESPENTYEVFVCEEGRINLLYAWWKQTEPIRSLDQETKKALEAAAQKLDSMTDPDERRQKVIELMRWSYRAVHGERTES